MFGLLGGLISTIFGNARIMLMIVIGVVIAAALLYWNYSQNKIQTLTAEKAQLEMAVQIQTQTIEKLQESIRKNNRDIIKLREAYEAIEKRAAEVNDFFRNNDIGEMARNNPQELKKIINKILNDMFLELEEITQLKRYEVQNVNPRP